MDIPDSTPNTTVAPPTSEQKILMKKRLEAKNELRQFRKSISEKIKEFAELDRGFIEIEAVDDVHRMAIYDIAAGAGLVSLFFNRQSAVVYKREHYPSEDEIKCRQNGDAWNEQTAKEYAKKRIEQLAQQQLNKMRIPAEAGSCSTKQPDNNKRSQVKPLSAFNARLGDLIGIRRARETAIKTERSQTYRFVLSHNKREQRPIQLTLTELQARKLQRLEQQIQRQQQQSQPQQMKRRLKQQEQQREKHKQKQQQLDQQRQQQQQQQQFQQHLLQQLQPQQLQQQQLQQQLLQQLQLQQHQLQQQQLQSQQLQQQQLQPQQLQQHLLPQLQQHLLPQLQQQQLQQHLLQQLHKQDQQHLLQQQKQRNEQQKQQQQHHQQQ